MTASRGEGTKEKKTLNLHDFLWAALCCHAVGFCPGADTPGQNCRERQAAGASGGSCVGSYVL